MAEVLQLSVVADRDLLQRARTRLRELSTRELPNALRGAVNDTAKSAVSHVSREIRQRVNVKKKDIDRFLHRTIARGKDQAVEVRLDKSKRIPLQYFGARMTQEHGITYRILKGGDRQNIPRAFGVDKSRYPGLHGGAFRRASVDDHRDTAKLVGRLPIIKLFGPSVWWVFLQAGSLQVVADEARADLRKNVVRRVRLALLRQKQDDVFDPEAA